MILIIGLLAFFWGLYELWFKPWAIAEIKKCDDNVVAAVQTGIYMNKVERPAELKRVSGYINRGLTNV